MRSLWKNNNFVRSSLDEKKLYDFYMIYGGMHQMVCSNKNFVQKLCNRICLISNLSNLRVYYISKTFFGEGRKKKSLVRFLVKPEI